MEISEVVNTQLVFPGLVVGLVLICAVLVFAFGFKSVEDFPFDKLATVTDDRKPAGKKRKVKDKKSQPNGLATVVSETKQSTSESTNIKVTSSKMKSIEKSPAKDVPKPSTKHEKKQGKLETSPAIAALKDTKNIKEINKINENVQKQAKGKDSGKQQKDQKSNKLSKSKGKENVEVKNKRNTEKSKNKAEEKPKDFDEGEWEQAFSRKDKKNRKPAAIEADNMAEKSVKTEVASPGKKKSKHATETAAPAEPEPVPASAAPTTVADEIPESIKDTKDKLPKKDKEQKEKSKPAEEAPAIENATTNVDSEGEGKLTKKKKKKPAAKDTPEEAAPVVEDKLVSEEPVSSKLKSAEPKKTEAAQTDGAVFDELGDTWKEAKTQKKVSKKKVRKAE